MDDVLAKAGQILKNGGLVAFPTETVYGLGANALDSKAAYKIYKAKGRPSDNPLIIHIASLDSLPLITSGIPVDALALAKRYWPGPLTMIFRKSDVVPKEITGGLESVAVRVPDHKVALALIEAGGGYIAAPSANTSGRPSPTKAVHVADDLGEKVDMIVDGGDTTIGLESTIVDFTSDEVTILRPGAITKAMIEAVIGPVQIATDKLIDLMDDVPKAPGMKYTHYAPKAPLVIVEGKVQAVSAQINKYVQEELAQGGKPGVICAKENLARYSQGLLISLGELKDEEGIARHLYSVLREFDEADVTSIYSESFDTPRLGAAIMNRLRKAAGYQIIRV